MTKKDPAKAPGKFFCSQYVSAVYNAGGVYLEIQFSDKFTTPRQISQSPLLEYAGTIRKGEE